jgi:hypothetical protein
MGAQQTKPTIIEITGTSVNDSKTVSGEKAPIILEDSYILKKDYNSNMNSLNLAYDTKFNNYFTKDEIKNLFVLQSQLKNYQPRGDYAAKEDLSVYQPRGDYALKGDLSAYQTIGNYALKEDLSVYQPRGDYALKGDLSSYQTRGDYVSKDDLSAYQPRGDYALKGDLSAYQPRGEYALKDDLNKYVYLLSSAYIPISDSINKLKANSAFTKLYKI